MSKSIFQIIWKCPWIPEIDIKSVKDCKIQTKFTKKTNNAVMGEKRKFLKNFSMNMDKYGRNSSVTSRNISVSLNSMDSFQVATN